MDESLNDPFLEELCDLGDLVSATERGLLRMERKITSRLGRRRRDGKEGKGGIRAENIGKSWKTIENHGKTIGKPWENNGKPLENHWKTIGKQ